LRLNFTITFKRHAIFLLSLEIVLKNVFKRI